jgi:methionine aminotransferase
MISFQSKLPNVNQSIFSVMSQMAATENALNLAQGFPEFNPPPELINFIYEAMLTGKNQYAPMPGYLSFREQIAIKERDLHQLALNPDTDITVVPGATVGLFVAIQTLVNHGDEVIVIEPAYDSYEPAITLAGGKAIRVLMDLNTFQIPWEELNSKVNLKTKLIIVNTPPNPLGTVFTHDDWQNLNNIVQQSNAYVLSDEVYEHMVFDGNTHISVLNIEGLKDRSIKVSSFGKTYHCTGWKMGYLSANAQITAELRKVYQFLTFACNSSAQAGIETFMKIDNNWEVELSKFYEQKRNLFRTHLQGSKWTMLPCNGSYFQVLSFEGHTYLNDMDYAAQLTKLSKIASIPISAFCNNYEKTNLLRFCFAKNDETIIQAANILCNL